MNVSCAATNKAKRHSIANNAQVLYTNDKRGVLRKNLTTMQPNNQKARKLSILSVAAVWSLLLIATPLRASALTINAVPAAKVSFTFDDGYTSALTTAAPTLAKYGFVGTDYVITNCVGMTKIRNACKADSDKTYLTWAQITQLQNSYGWEIGSHTVSHPLLATSDPAEGQPNVLTPDQVTNELSQSKAALSAHGINAANFSTPYGDYSPKILAEIAKYYSSQRGFNDVGYNSWPNSDYFLKVQTVSGQTSVATIKGYVDAAAANNQWLVLVFHDIKTKASTRADDYEYSTGNLDQVAAYVKSKNINVVKVNDGLVRSDVNLLANPSFNNGLGDGWSTDSPTGITADSANNGSYPDPANAVKLTADSQTGHLFSPQVEVDPDTTYMLKNFLNVAQLSGGEVGFYIDEYDGFGNWVSGQFKAAEKSVFVEEMNFSYKPTSDDVKSASLQVYVTGNSGITAYLDNSQWFPLYSTAPTPPSGVTFIPNGSFDAGISGGWTTDGPANITADSLNNGSPANPVNSVKFVSGTKSTHLFSSKIGINYGQTYTISTYVNAKKVTTTSSGVGFYIDEYDANGQWISGQYKATVHAVGKGNVVVKYVASSANVKSASLQIINSANAGILAYIDDVRWN